MKVVKLMLAFALLAGYSAYAHDSGPPKSKSNDQARAVDTGEVDSPFVSTGVPPEVVEAVAQLGEVNAVKTPGLQN